MVIPSRNAISSADVTEEKDGVGLKKEERHTKFYPHTLFHFQESDIENVDSRWLQGSSWPGREVKKANQQEDQLDWREGEKRAEAVGIARRLGKTKGANGTAGQRQGEVKGRRRHIA